MFPSGQSQGSAGAAGSLTARAWERSLPAGVLGARLTARPSGAHCPGREEGFRAPAVAADAAIGDRSDGNPGRRDAGIRPSGDLSTIVSALIVGLTRA